MVSFLLDTNICTAYLKRPAVLVHRFNQYSGRLYIPTIVVGELYTWAYSRSDPIGFAARVDNDLLNNLTTLDFDADCAREFGRTRAGMLRNGITVGRIDVQIAAVTLVHGLTLVTNNTKDFENIPGLRLEDWLTP